MLDSKRKSKSVSGLDFTQPSLYSESPTQTLRVNSETDAKNLKKQSDGIDIPNTPERSFSIGCDSSKRKNKSFRKRAPNILFKQIAQAPTTSKIIMSKKEQHTTSSAEATNITSTTQTVKSHHWLPKEIIPSTSGSVGS